LVKNSFTRRIKILEKSNVPEVFQPIRTNSCDITDYTKAVSQLKYQEILEE